MLYEVTSVHFLHLLDFVTIFFITFLLFPKLFIEIQLAIFLDEFYFASMTLSKKQVVFNL